MAPRRGRPRSTVAHGEPVAPTARLSVPDVAFGGGFGGTVPITATEIRERRAAQETGATNPVIGYLVDRTVEVLADHGSELTDDVHRLPNRLLDENPEIDDQPTGGKG